MFELMCEAVVGRSSICVSFILWWRILSLKVGSIYFLSRGPHRDLIELIIIIYIFFGNEVTNREKVEQVVSVKYQGRDHEAND
jgi:hypothetical protein